LYANNWRTGDVLIDI